MSIDKYYYLISSLPALSLDRTPEIDSAAFLERCRHELSDARFHQLEQVALIPGTETAAAGVAGRWQAWETYLRNLLVWRRTHHAGAEQAHQWLRPEADVFPGIIRRVDEAVSEDHSLERERILDNLRWAQLDHLQVGHEFDFAALIIYRIRLLVAEKWAGYDAAKGAATFSEICDQLVEQAMQLHETEGES